MDQGASNWFQDVIVEPIQAFAYQLLAFLPRLIGAVILFVLGLLIAKAIERLFVQLLKMIGLDKLADQTQLSSVLIKGGIRKKLSELIGTTVYWLVMLAVVMVTFNALELTVAAQLFQQVVSFLPNVIAALFIFIIGIFAAAFLSMTIRTAAGNAGMRQASMLGQLAQIAVIVFSGVAALQQLQIRFVGEVFMIVLSGISLACGIAFGLGCKDQAGEWVRQISQQIKEQNEDNL